MDTQTLQTALQEVQRVLEQRWALDRIDGQTFQFQYITTAGIPVGCLAWINPHSAGFFFRVVMQMPVDAAVRATMAELLTRINYPLPNGAFALDYDTGDLRYKSALFFGGTTLTRPLIQNVVDSSLQFVDQYIHPLVKVQMGASLDEAFAPCHEEKTASQGNDRASFEDFIASYLRALFIGAGLEDVTRAEVDAFQQHLETTLGNPYLFGGYDGIPRQQLNARDMRAAYEQGTLQNFSANAQAQALVFAYTGEIRRQRQRLAQRS